MYQECFILLGDVPATVVLPNPPRPSCVICQGACHSPMQHLPAIAGPFSHDDSCIPLLLSQVRPFNSREVELNSPNVINMNGQFLPVCASVHCSSRPSKNRVHQCHVSFKSNFFLTAQTIARRHVHHLAKRGWLQRSPHHLSALTSALVPLVHRLLKRQPNNYRRQARRWRWRRQSIHL